MSSAQEEELNTTLDIGFQLFVNWFIVKRAFGTSFQHSIGWVVVKRAIITMPTFD
jgi:hypothetical protein